MNDKIQVVVNCNGEHKLIMLPPKVCLIRHCQSLMNYLSDEANIHNNPQLMSIFIDNGHWDKDIQLSDTGLAQAEVLGKYWIENSYNTKYMQCITSPYKRCIQTAYKINSYFSSDSCYKEKDSGKLFARNHKQMCELIPDYEELSKDKWSFSGCQVQSFEQLQKRLFDAIQNIASCDIIILTHSDVITTFKSMFESKAEQTFNDYINSLAQDNYPHNGEIIEYDFELGTVQNTRIIYDQLEWKYCTGITKNLTMAKLYVK